MLKKSHTMFITEYMTVLEISYHNRNPYIMNMEKETNSSKRKTCISSTSRRKLIHDPHIFTKCS